MSNLCESDMIFTLEIPELGWSRECKIEDEKMRDSMNWYKIHLPDMIKEKNLIEFMKNEIVDAVNLAMNDVMDDLNR